VYFPPKQKLPFSQSCKQHRQAGISSPTCVRLRTTAPACSSPPAGAVQDVLCAKYTGHSVPHLAGQWLVSRAVAASRTTYIETGRSGTKRNDNKLGAAAVCVVARAQHNMGCFEHLAVTRNTLAAAATASFCACRHSHSPPADATNTQQDLCAHRRSRLLWTQTENPDRRCT
jgi:hypothetical protein